MSEFAYKRPETIYLGFEDNENLYIREGYLTDKVLIDVSHEDYRKLVGLLGDDFEVTFMKLDIEYGFLMDIYKKLSEEDII